jgi:uncharacterized protein with PQ loop repeat
MSNMSRAAVCLIVCSLALFVAELQVRREASTQYICLGLIWITVVGMLIWTVYGA